MYSVGEVSIISEGDEDDASTCGMVMDSQDERGLAPGNEVSADTTQGSEERDTSYHLRMDDMVTKVLEEDRTEADEVKKKWM